MGEKLFFRGHVTIAGQIGARTFQPYNYSLRLGFDDGLGLWLGSGHLLPSGDGLGLGFWFRKEVQKSQVQSHVTGGCALASDLVRAVIVLTTGNNDNNAINPKDKNFIKGLYCLKQRMTTVSPHLKCLKYERLIGLSDFEDTLVTRLYFRGVWTVEIMLLKLMQEKRAIYMACNLWSD